MTAVLRSQDTALFSLDRAVLAVDFVAGDDAARGADSLKDLISLHALKNLPRIRLTIASIDIPGVVVDKEDPEVIVPVLTTCCKHSAVTTKLDNVIDGQFIKFNWAHSTPPINVVKRALTEGVSPLEVFGAPAGPLLATMFASSATEGEVCGRVNNFNYRDCYYD